MRGTVLVVEDEPDLMLTFRIVLQTAGYEVIKAPSGEDALRLLAKVVPDAVILDLGLPGIDGWQVLSAIRRADRLPGVPVVIASANAEAGEQRRAKEFGCSEMLTKPFSAEELRSTLERVLTGAPNGLREMSSAPQPVPVGIAAGVEPDPRFRTSPASTRQHRRGQRSACD
jgi:CheY-like chemotaxis protein